MGIGRSIFAVTNSIMHNHRHAGRLVPAGLSLLAAVMVCFAMQGRQTEDVDARVTKRIFLSGGSEETLIAGTGWPNTKISWVIKSNAGMLSQGELNTDGNGVVKIQFQAPKVKVATRLAFVIAGLGDNGADPRIVEIIVFPAEAFTNFSETLNRLDIGILEKGDSLSQTLKKSRIASTNLKPDSARAAFKGKTVIISSLAPEAVDSARKWISTLPRGTGIILINGASGSFELPFASGLLKQATPSGKTAPFVKEQEYILWTDLEPGWIGLGRCPSSKLYEPKWVTELRVPAGCIDSDGTIYPLVLEAADMEGRNWLIWSMPVVLAEDDPRLVLILRNSLLWAAKLEKESNSDIRKESISK